MVNRFIEAVEGSCSRDAQDIVEESNFEVFANVRVSTVTIQNFWGIFFTGSRWPTLSNALRILAELVEEHNDILERRARKELVPAAEIWQSIEWNKVWVASCKSTNLLKNFITLLKHDIIPENTLPADGQLAEEIRNKVHRFEATEQLKYPRMYASDEALRSLKTPIQILAENIDFLSIEGSEVEDHKDDVTLELKVLLLGDAGVGKSCLINQMHGFGDDDERKQDEAVGGVSLTSHFTPVTAAFDSDHGQRKIITLVDSPGSTRDIVRSEKDSNHATNDPMASVHIESNMERYFDYIVDSICMLEEDGTPKAPVQLILWCISGSATRVSEEDRVLFKSIGSQFKIPIIVVFTRGAAHVDNISRLTEDIKSSELGDIRAFHIIQARSEKTAYGTILPPIGLDKLALDMAKVYNCSFREVHYGLSGIRVKLSTQQIHERAARVDQIIKNAVLSSAACGALPPGFDDISAYGVTTMMIGAMLMQYRVRTKMSASSILWYITKAIAGRGVFTVMKLGYVLALNAFGDAMKVSGWLYGAGATLSAIGLAATTHFVGETLRNSLDSETKQLYGMILDAESMKATLETETMKTMQRVQDITDRTKELLKRG